MPSSPPERGWRVGRHVPRNVYRDGVPVAMIAGAPEDAERTAVLIVTACNAMEDRSPGAAMDDAEALRVAADMAVNLGGPEIAKVMREVARRLEVYSYG